MPFDGAGNYSPPGPPIFPAITETTISSAYFNQVILDIANNGLSKTFLRDGSVPFTSDISLGGHKILALADPTLPQGAATKAYVDRFAATDGSGSSLVTYLPAGTGAVVSTAQAKLRERWSNSDRGAVNDGATNDTAANTVAVADSLVTPLARTLNISGVSALAASVPINRQPGTTFTDTSGEFIIAAEGLGAGFAVSTAITMFTSTLTFTTFPVSERIRFKDDRFYSSDKTLAAYVIDQKFLKIAFDHTAFDAIKLLNSPIYTQELRLTNIDVRRWQGTWCTSAGTGYAFRCSDSIFENGGAVFDFNVLDGSSITNPGVQSNTGTFLTMKGCSGFTLSAGYWENYSIAQVILGEQTLSGGRASGFIISGNSFKSAIINNPAIKTGVAYGATVGNYCNDILADTTYAKIGKYLSVGDATFARKFTDDGFYEVTADGITLMGVPGGGHVITNNTAHAGGGQANATPLIHPTNYVGVCATLGDSVALPPTAYIVEEHGFIVWVVNDGATTLYTYYAQSDVTNFGGGGGRTVPFIIPAGQVRGFLAVGQGKWRMVSLPQAVAVPTSTATGTNSVAVPTMAEFNALVAAHNSLLGSFNALLASLRTPGTLAP